MTESDVAQKPLGAWRYVGTRIDGGNWDRGAHLKGINRPVLRGLNSTLEVTWERIK